MNKRSHLLIVVLLLFAFSGLYFSNSTGPPLGMTGGPGDSTCAQGGCHTTNGLNEGPGSLDLDGVPLIYTPGQTYDLQVILEQQGQSRWGFQLAARDENDAFAGTLQAGGDGFTQVQAGNFISHTAAGTRAGTNNGPVTFNFRWTAPANDVGNITFNVAGNAANGNFANTGDFIYTFERAALAPGGSGGFQPTANAIVLPYVEDTAAFRSNLGMTSRGPAVNVTANFMDSGGQVVGSKTYPVAAGGLTQVNIQDIPGATGRQGYLFLEPDQANAITAFATPIDNVTFDSAVIQGTRGTTTRVLSPTSASIGAFLTTLTVINDSPIPNTVEIKLKNTSGTVTAMQNTTISPYGFFHTENIHNFLGVSGTFGPIEINSTSGGNILAVSRVYSTISTSNGTGQTSSFFSAEPQ